jgi:Arc/MetJ-type ribon-helix-helix transcriptional regulator
MLRGTFVHLAILLDAAHVGARREVRWRGIGAIIGHGEKLNRADDPCHLRRLQRSSLSYREGVTIQLKPETEALIEKRLLSGAFSSPEEVIERALAILSEEEEWFAENRDDLATKIEEGWEEAQRGHLIGGDQVRVEMQQFKSEWIGQRRTA